jgi:hypothetical protein
MRAQQEAEAIAERRRNSRGETLDRLSKICDALARLQREEDELRAERDEVIDALRELDTSWNLLALRTGLSRQALIKRRRSVGGRI